jgi:predicted Zn-dependent protease
MSTTVPGQRLFRLNYPQVDPDADDRAEARIFFDRIRPLLGRLRAAYGKAMLPLEGFALGLLAASVGLEMDRADCEAALDADDARIFVALLRCHATFSTRSPATDEALSRWACTPSEVRRLCTGARRQAARDRTQGVGNVGGRGEGRYRQDRNLFVFVEARRPA